MNEIFSPPLSLSLSLSLIVLFEHLIVMQLDEFVRLNFLSSLSDLVNCIYSLMIT